MNTLRDAMSHAALGWVKPELDETLRQARSEIEYFVEAPADASRMRFCAGYLHQVQGTLRMVELYAPAMVAEELELLAEAVREGGVPDRDEACATLMRGTVLLPDYLERLQNGHRDIPIVLLPLLNEIRAARGAEGINEGVLLAFDPEAGKASEAELEHARGSLSGRNRELLDTVGNAVKEELMRIKDALDLHMRLGGGPAALQTQVNELGAVADTLGVMGLGVARGVVAQQRDALREVADGTRKLDDNLLLDVAGALLYVDASLDDQVACLGASLEGDEDPGAVETRRTVEVLAHEAIANFAAAREAFVAFIETNWDHARLHEVPRLLDEVSGALRMLDLQVPADYMNGVRQYIGVELIGRKRVPSGRQLDTLADAMASLEYYLEALRERRPGREEILDITRSSLEALHYWPVPAATAEDAVAAPAMFAAFAPAVSTPPAEAAADTGESEASGEAAASPSLPVAELPAPPAQAPRPLLFGDAIHARPSPLPATPPPLPPLDAVPVAGDAAAGAADVSPSLEPAGVADAEPVLAPATKRSLAPAMDATGETGAAPAPQEASPAFDPVAAELDAAPLADMALLPFSAGSADESATAETPVPEEARRAASTEFLSFDPVAAEQWELADAPASAMDMAPAFIDAGAFGFSAGETAVAASGNDAHEALPLETAARQDGNAATFDLPEPESVASREDTPSTPVVQEEAAPAVEDATNEAASLPFAGADAHPVAPVSGGAAAEHEMAAFMAELDKAAAAFDPHASPAVAEGAPASVAPALETPDPVAAAPALEGGFDNDADEIDQDIRDVFIEEFDEELQNLSRLLPAWRAAPGSAERLRPVRRVFHTLKGSGRLVGARTLGEFSWKIESMLNRVLDGSRPASPAVMALVNQAYEVLPQFNAALRGNGRIEADVPGMQAVADRIAAGEEAFHVAGVAAETPVPAAAPVAAGTPASVDSVLREILEAEVGQHLGTVEAWLAQSRPEPQPVTEELLRAVHTMSGAFAMTEVPEITAVTAPVESFVKRSLANAVTPTPEGIAALGEAARAVAATITALQAPAPLIPSFAALAVRLQALVDALPEAQWPPQVYEDFDDADMADVAAPVTEEATPVPEAQELAGIGDLSAYFDPSLLEASFGAAPAREAPVAAPADDAAPPVAEWSPEEEFKSGPEAAVSPADTDFSWVQDDAAHGSESVVSLDQAGHEDGAAGALSGLVADDVEEAVGPEVHEVPLAEAAPAAPGTEPQDGVDDSVLPQEAAAAGIAAAADAGDGPALPEEDAEDVVAAVLPDAIDDALSEALPAMAEAAPPAPAIELAPLTAPVDELPVPAPSPDVSALDAGPLDFNDLDRELVDIFVEEGKDLLDHCDRLISDLRAAPEDREVLAGLQRDLHTLKGGARMAGINAIGDLGHGIESLLEAVAANRTEIGRGDVRLLERGFDRLHQLLIHTGEHRAVRMPADLIDAFEARTGGHAPTAAHGAVPESPASLPEPFEPAQADATSDAETGLEEETPAEGTALAVAPEPAVPSVAAASPDAEANLPVGDASTTAEDMPAPATLAEADAPPTEPLPPVLAGIAVEPLSAPVVEAAATDEDGVPRTQEQVRVRADLLDRLVNHAGEVAIYRSRLEQQLGAFRSAMGELDRTNARLRDQLRRLDLETEAQIVARYRREQEQADQAFDPLELDRFSTLQQLSRALNESAADLGGLQSVLDDLSRNYDALLQQQSRVSSELQDGLMRARMVPFDGLVPRLRRVVRQAAQDTGKQVQLHLEGTHGELDRNVLDRMVAPLEHMLRNSVAHGLETPSQRVAAGKPEEGGISLRLRREGSEIVLEVADDGAGLDREAIRRRGEQRGLIAAGEQIDDAGLDNLIFASGFSTSEQVSQLAGRGVGMDVVRNEVRQLGGSVDIHSVRGQGVTFTLRLPQTLAVTQAVFVRIGDTTFAVPVASVSGIGRIARERFMPDQGVYHYNGEDFALHDLGTLVGQVVAKAEGQPQIPLLLVRAGDLRAAVAIDQVLGNREIVVKPVGLQIASVPGIYGATITGEGNVVVILDVAPLVRRHLAQPQAPVHAAAAVNRRHMPLVMVVDDSLTMRKVTGRILERHNFEVVVARDGVEALERLEEQVPDLMLLDIEMPRMDGYELATAMRADPRYKNVPIVMITSRSGDKHRQRAFEIGVQRYLGKPYQELDLMRNVYDLLGIARVRE